jgi:hypothetical protein
MISTQTQELYSRVLLVAQSFKGPFTTEQLIRKLAARYPLTWARLVKLYGPYGKNAGSYYTSASRVAAVLLAHSVRQRIAKLHYGQASRNWGSPVVRTWKP